MDPYAVLGVRPGSPEHEIAAAYREQAKRWHPDVAGSDERMAEINAAYDLLRVAEDGAPTREEHWLIAPLRQALGPELLQMLTPKEDVRLVTPCSTWASPHAILAVTERRLLWLLDDAPVARVRTAPLRDVAEIATRSQRLRRKVATLQLKMTNGRRHAFAELRPHTAATIERQVRAARGA